MQMPHRYMNITSIKGKKGNFGADNTLFKIDKRDLQPGNSSYPKAIMTNLAYSILLLGQLGYLKNANTSAENSGVLDAALWSPGTCMSFEPGIILIKLVSEPPS